MKQEPTIRDVMGRLEEMRGDIGILSESMQEFATSVDQRFDKVESEMVDVRSELVEVRSELGHVKNQMVTKGYLDDKLADHHSDLIIWVRREDQKVLETVKGWMGKK